MKVLVYGLMIIMAINYAVCSSELSCPFLLHFPLDLVKNNLMFNQHEFLRKFLDFSANDIEINDLQIVNF